MKLKFPLLSLIRSKYTSVKPNNKETPAIPEFIYAGKNVKPHTRIYVMGISTHGALGVRRFLRPAKKQHLFKYMQRPHRLTFADTRDVDDIACGYGFTVLAMNHKENHPFFGTGVATNCQIGLHKVKNQKPLEVLIEPNPIDIPLLKASKKKKVSCGRAHTILWTDEEGLWTFGNNAHGQCGRPVTDATEDYGSRVTYHNVAELEGKNVKQIECGSDTSFVLCNGGEVYSCGWSSDGQTGRGSYKQEETFGLVGGDLKGERVITISSKTDCVLALTDKGDVFGWGNSEYRQLASATEEQQLNTPKRLALSSIQGKVVDVAASGTACFALTDSGDVWSWGYGILGRGPDNLSSFQPERIPNTLLGRNILNENSKVTKIFAGSTCAAAVTNDGGLYSWGRNTGGCLGLGHTQFQYFPMRVCVASQVVRVSCGFDHMAVFAKSLL